MNLNIGSLSFANYNNVLGRNIQKKQNNKCIPFKASSFNTTLGYTFITAAMLSLASCNNKKAEQPEITVKTVQTDKNMHRLQNVQEPETEHLPTKLYHYDPTDEPLRAEDYSWTETIYPDGRIEKDSIGYKISITADGKRISIHTETDKRGNSITTTIYPDLTKLVRIDYKTEKPGEVLYTETKYRSDGSMEERRFYNEFIVTDSTNIPQIIIEKSIHKYNEKDVLIMWDSNITDSLRSIDYNEYDKKGRLIYDDIKQERYEYKGDSKYPFRSVSECDSCQRIRIYNADGTIDEDYFKAADGTITQATDSIM